jgi:hypothetical protein
MKQLLLYPSKIMVSLFMMKNRLYYHQMYKFTTNYPFIRLIERQKMELLNILDQIKELVTGPQTKTKNTLSSSQKISLIFNTKRNVDSIKSSNR